MRSAAFTLVELLVVISIITLLAALAFPVFAISRQQARTVACRAKIHELLLSLHNYETEYQSLPYGFDFKGGTPPPGGSLGYVMYDTPGWWWFHFAGVVRHGSGEALDVIRCPSKRLQDPILDGDVLCGNYGVNRSLCKTAFTRQLYDEAFGGPPLSASNIRHPGSTLLLVDSGYTLITWWHAAADPPVKLGDTFIEDTAYVPGLEINKERRLWPGQSCDAIRGRHPHKTVNVGFADGHAEPKRADELQVERTEDGSYTNTVLWQGQ
jgi:prepilin-type processing-associated H-X9-DG protein/prepilin-type N-terminal cleavage/methylation domain-containing protein